MFNNVRNYVYQRRKTLVTATGIAAAVYLAGQYLRDRLEEIRAQVVQEKAARENLRRRFQQNQEDCTYTILALVPTLGDRILEEMDVESLTFTLQTQSRAANAKIEGSTSSDMNASSLSLNTELPSLASSIELAVPERRRPAPDVQSLSSSRVGESAQDWVDQFGQSLGSAASDAEHPSHEVTRDGFSPISSHLSDSITSASLSLASGSDGIAIESLHSAPSESSESQPGVGVERPPLTRQRKAELWREIKLLTFTRTLTILYSTTLLSLLTHIQLNMLGRYKYVQSVIDLEQEEKLRERQAFEASVAGLFWGSGEADLESLENDYVKDKMGLFGTGRTGGTERQYLTLSWWLIHVGWREIGDRVRTAVEDVFEGVSLKTLVGMEELERLLKDVRQRVEYDNSASGLVGVEGGRPTMTSMTGPRINFLPSMIPPTPETLRDVLIQGGLPSSMSSIDDPAFTQLVDETRAFVSSVDFGRVLGASLDHATGVLFDGLRRTLFPERIPQADVAPEEKIKLAGLLPAVARWSHSAIHGTPNELVEGLTDVRELAGFSAIIYSSYADTFR